MPDELRAIRPEDAEELLLRLMRLAPDHLRRTPAPRPMAANWEEAAGFLYRYVKAQSAAAGRQAAEIGRLRGALEQIRAACADRAAEVDPRSAEYALPCDALLQIAGAALTDGR